MVTPKGQRGKQQDWCGCDTSILVALFALSDWAEGTLDNFYRELDREVYPEDSETNSEHLDEFLRIGRECFLGAKLIENSGCQHPAVLQRLREVGGVAEAARAVPEARWSRELGSMKFVAELKGVVYEMRRLATDCKANILRTMAELV